MQSSRIQRCSRARTSGFSMLELMIAIAILSFGVLAMFAAQVTSLKFNRESNLRTEAAYLAEQQLEAFHAMNGAAIEVVRTDPGYPNDNNNPLDPDPNDGAPRQFFRSWTITPDSPEANVYTLNVVVAWQDAAGITRSVNLSSLKRDS